MEKSKKLVKEDSDKQKSKTKQETTKIETTEKNSYKRFNVSIIDNNDPPI